MNRESQSLLTFTAIACMRFVIQIVSTAINRAPKPVNSVVYFEICDHVCMHKILCYNVLCIPGPFGSYKAFQIEHAGQELHFKG